MVEIDQFTGFNGKEGVWSKHEWKKYGARNKLESEKNWPTNFQLGKEVPRIMFVSN